MISGRDRRRYRSKRLGLEYNDVLRYGDGQTGADTNRILIPSVRAVVAMSVYPTGSFENELQRRIYEYV